METKELIELIAHVLSLVGVAVIIIGAVLATAKFIAGWIQNKKLLDDYRAYRRNLGRGILLGLEFLVAADIIESIANQSSLESVFILAIIVLIRSFLAIELEMEIEGRWPWQRDKKTA